MALLLCGAAYADLDSVREATIKYHNVENAIADGYVPVGECEAQRGRGAMGVHYMNPALVNATVDPLQPELLLYVPTADGERLVGVEYFVPAALVNTTPSVLGRFFDGPMDGHEPGMPVHYDLHVWLWSHNPRGVFAQHNMMLSCANATG